MVTYGDLFTFVIMICEIIALVVLLSRKRKNSALSVEGPRYFLVTFFTGG